MREQHEHLLEEVLKLSPIDRAEFIEALFATFEFPSRRRIDALWAKEAEDRINAYNRGELKARPAEEVFADVRKGSMP